MSSLAKRFVTAAVLLSGLLRIAWAAHAGFPPARPAPGIHIWLVDLADLPQKVRAPAEAVVIQIFRQAGLELNFVECLSAPATPCRKPPGKADFWLQILNRQPTGLPEDTAGFTVLVPSLQPGDSYAAVSYPMVESVARQLDARPADVLAASMAHEIGHLVLHSRAHFRTGIMSPRLDRRQIGQLERGELLFTPEQAASLREQAAR